MMEVAAKYRAIACLCLIIGALSALGRWQLESAPLPPQNAPETQPLSGTNRSLTPPKLAAPDFLRFETVPLDPYGNVELADNGSVLTVEVNPETQKRIFRYLPSEGSIKEYRSDNSTRRYALSRGGRLFQFESNPMGFGASRRGDFRVSLDQLLTTTANLMGTPKRFLDNGLSINYRMSQHDGTSLQLVRQGQPPKTVFQSYNQFGIAEIDDLGRIWIWEVKAEGRKRSYFLNFLDKDIVKSIPLPSVQGTPKLVTSNKETTIITVRADLPSPHHRAFRRVAGNWEEIFPPTGFESVLVQKVTNDGLMFGALQTDTTNFVPVVWKDGVAYDLRRHAKWPLGGVRSFVELASRRGDVISTSVGTLGETDMSTTLLRRLPAK